MNVSGTGGYSNLVQAGQGVNQSAERIASGLRINSAKDDAAGLAISNRATSVIRGYDQSIRNANDGISMLQTAGGALEGVTDMVQRIRELALQASNGTLSASDRKAINAESKQLLGEVQRTVETTTFNNKPLLTNDTKVSLQVGPNEGDTLSLSDSNFSKKLDEAGFQDIDLGSTDGASAALSVLDQVQEFANTANADIGAQLNRLDSTINSLSIGAEKAAASRSRILDADMAKEATALSGERVKQNAALSMQAQANANRGNVLSLLGL